MTNANDVMIKQLDILDKVVTNGLQTTTVNTNNHKVGDIVLNNIFNDEWLMLDGVTTISSIDYPELAMRFCILPLVRDMNNNFYSIKAK